MVLDPSKPGFHKEVHVQNMQRTKDDLQRALALPDRRIIQAVEAIGELEESQNVLTERLREWYSLYYPEASAHLQKGDTFVRVASKAKTREDVQNISNETVGADLSGKDMFVIRSLALSVHNSSELMIELKEYLEKLMKNNFQNLNAVAGFMVGAKLLSLAGDSQRLARMPSSTVQVLGSEKALFRHLTTGAKPPKYGAILQHNLLQNARRHERGKVARTLAAKISIAIKADVYGDSFIGDQLNADLDKRMKSIRWKADKNTSKESGKPSHGNNKPFKHDKKHMRNRRKA